MDLGACPESHMERLKIGYPAPKEKGRSDPRFIQFQQGYESIISKILVQISMARNVSR